MLYKNSRLVDFSPKPTLDNFTIAACKFVYLCGNEQDREKAHLMATLAKIDSRTCLRIYK